MPRRANVLTADCVQVDDSAFPQSLLNDMDEAATTTSRATAEARRCVRPVDERSSTARDMFQKSLSKSMSSYYKVTKRYVCIRYVPVGLGVMKRNFQCFRLKMHDSSSTRELSIFSWTSMKRLGNWWKPPGRSSPSPALLERRRSEPSTI